MVCLSDQIGKGEFYMDMRVNYLIRILFVLALILTACAPAATQLPAAPPEIEGEPPSPPDVDVQPPEPPEVDVEPPAPPEVDIEPTEPPEVDQGLPTPPEPGGALPATPPEVDNTLPTPPLPTPTQIPQPTEAPQPTEILVPVEMPPGDPAALLGPPDGVDYFDTSSNFTGMDNECFSSQVTGGQYVITAKGLPEVACWEVSWPQVDHFYIETQVNMPQTCQPEDRFGVLFRAPDNLRGYLYELSCAGEVSMTKWDGENTAVIIPVTKSPAVKIGPGQQNRLGLSAYGSSYRLYMNGIYVAEGIDSSYTLPGKIGYFVRAVSEQSFTAAYDYFKIWLLSDDFIPPESAPPADVTLVPPPASGLPMVTANTYVNVRGGPGTNYPVYGVAAPGSQAGVIGVSQDSGWWNISVAPETVPAGNAWVSADYVTPSSTENVPVVPAPPLPPEVAPLPPTEGIAMVTSTDAVNVRNGPNNFCTSYGVAPIGASAPAVGISVDELWYQILISTDVAPDGLGWVNANYLITSNTENLPVTESSICN